MKIEYKHIHFRLEGKKKKTEIWSIYNNIKLQELGTIEWYCPWRQYCSRIETGVVLSKSCHLDIAEFIERLMEKHKSKESKK